MANLVLTTSSQSSYLSSTWSSWATAPHDLLLVTEDGSVGAHCAILLPLSKYCSSILEAPSFAGPIQVVLVGSSVKAVAAVKNLVYTGTCLLDRPILPEILDTLTALGIKVSKESFTLEAKTVNNVTCSTPTPFDIQDASVVTGAVSNGVLGTSREVEENEDDRSGTVKEVCGDEAETFHASTVGKVSQSTVNCSTRGHEEKLTAQKEEIHRKSAKIRIPKLKTNELSSKENTFTCRHSGCKLGFALKDSLRLHIKNLHPKKKLYSCDRPGCNSAYVYKFGLTEHVKIVHTKEKLGKKYHCSEPGCGLTVRFKDKRGLQDHRRSEHGAEKLICKSENCTKTFTNSRSLWGHEKKAHNGENLYQCIKCPKKFSQKSSLNVHTTAVHKEKRPHQCNQCLKKFFKRGHLRRHIEMVHNEEKTLP